MTLQVFTDVLSLVLIGLGAFFAFSAAVGLVRFHDTMSKIHATTKPQTVGLMLTITGAIIRVLGHEDFSINNRSDLGVLVLLVLFALMTNPVSAQRVGRVARREGLYAGSDEMTANLVPGDRGLRSRANRAAGTDH